MQVGAKARTLKAFLFLPIGTELILVDDMSHSIADTLCPYLFKDIVNERDVKPNKYWLKSTDFEWVAYDNPVGEELLKKATL
jgi:hypothetical protein